MGTDSIEGVVTDDGGNPISDGLVSLFLRDRGRGNIVRYRRTKSDGSYTFFGHPDADGTVQDWHVACADLENSSERQFLSNPGVTADLPNVRELPDTVDYYLPFAADSGTDLLGIADPDATLQTAGNWSTNTDFYAGTAAQFDDANSEYWITDSPVSGINQQKLSVAAWVYKNAGGGDNNAPVVGCMSSDGSRPDDGWVIENNTNNGQLQCRMMDNGSENITGNINKLPDGVWRMIGLALDGNSVDLYNFDDSSLNDNTSSSNPRNTGVDQHLGGMGNTSPQDNYIHGKADIAMIAFGETLSKSQFQDIRDKTKRVTDV